MPESPRTSMTTESVPLDIKPGPAEECNQVVISDSHDCCNDRHHRKLAICSIICGFTCIGIIALISSVKAQTTEDPQKKARFSYRAKKCGIISIVAWYGFVFASLILMALVSYLLSLRE